MEKDYTLTENKFSPYPSNAFFKCSSKTANINHFTHFNHLRATDYTPPPAKPCPAPRTFIIKLL